LQAKGGNTVVTQKAHWTVLVYIAAHNELGDYGLGRRSLDQILKVGSTPQLKLAALYDQFEGATRIIAGEAGQAAVEEALSDFDSGDPDALLETARWAFERCPAQRYALVLWSHGSGWRPEEGERSSRGQPFSSWSPQEIERIARQARGDDQVSRAESTERAARPSSTALFRTTLAHILKRDPPDERAVCFDDGSGHSLDTLELERVARQVEGIIGQPLDLLGMDACLMATLEVAYQVRQHVRYLVASEELVPGYSWPYDAILGAMRETPDMPARDLAALVVQRYLDFYTDNPPQLNYGDVTKVALDLARVGKLAQAADGLAGALLDKMEEQTGHLWEAQRQTRARETLKGRRRPSKFDYHLWDLGALAACLATHSDNGAVQDAAREVGAALQAGDAVVAEGHRGEWFEGMGGVSIYAVPPGEKRRISPFYPDVALAKETRWAEMLNAYHRQEGTRD
jgi:hypothetical protein